MRWWSKLLFSLYNYYDIARLQQQSVKYEETKLPTTSTYSEKEILEAVERYYDKTFYNYSANFESMFGSDIDERDWELIGSLSGPNVDKESPELILRMNKLCRKIATYNPIAIRSQKLYKDFVFGRAFTINLVPNDENEDSDKLPDSRRIEINKIAKQSEKAWKKFLEYNSKRFSITEMGGRAWRDGECFIYTDTTTYPIKAHFLDADTINNNGADDPDYIAGILADKKDLSEVTKYNWCPTDGNGSQLGDNEELDASDVIHIKIDADTTEVRGRSRYASVADYLLTYRHFLRNEAAHRIAQSAIVMVRKVAGGRAEAQQVVDNASIGTLNGGQTVTVGKGGVDIEFKQPQSNFSDATPLAKLLIQQISAATGWTYEMLSSDNSGGNFASALVAESPVVSMVEAEREYFMVDISNLFMRVMAAAVTNGDLDVPADELQTLWKPFAHFPKIIQRDILKDAQAANIGVMAHALSPQEMSRRLNADPEKMQREIQEIEDAQADRMLGGSGVIPNTMPTQASKQASSQANAQAGAGTNQNAASVTGHSDSLI
jgi:capsid protein